MHTALKAYRKAVLTLEAALALPVFMMCLLTLASLLLMNCTGLRLQALLQIQEELRRQREEREQRAAREAQENQQQGDGGDQSPE